MPMFTANSYRRHDIVNRHATLLAMIVEEAALPHEMLLLVSQQDVLRTVVRCENRLLGAIDELAGSVRFFEAKMKSKLTRAVCNDVVRNSHFILGAIQLLQQSQRFAELLSRSLGGSILLDAFELLHPSTQLNLPLLESFIARKLLSDIAFEMMKRTERWNVKDVEIRMVA
jgi:hypothetical protein